MDFAKLKHDFALADLERLAAFEPPSKPPPLPGVDPDRCSIALDLLKKRSRNNTESIQESIKQRAFGGKNDISWKMAFLPFMESCAVYLRDWGTYRKAWKTYREYKIGTTNDPSACETAISLYQDASRQIEELAEVWLVHA